MKRILLGLAVLGVTTWAGAAQIFDSVENPRLKLGFQAGMSFSNLNTPSDLAPSNRDGLAAGINVELPVASYFSIQPEALFVQKGADILAGNVRFTARYNSLEFPVLAKLKLPGNFTPFLVAGPVAILNMGESVESAGPGGGAALGFKPKTFDFAATVGAGIEAGPVFVSARYSLGLTELNQNSAQWKSRGIYVLAGLRI